MSQAAPLGKILQLTNRACATPVMRDAPCRGWCRPRDGVAPRVVRQFTEHPRLQIVRQRGEQLRGSGFSWSTREERVAGALRVRDSAIFVCTSRPTGRGRVKVFGVDVSAQRVVMATPAVVTRDQQVVTRSDPAVVEPRVAAFARGLEPDDGFGARSSQLVNLADSNQFGFGMSLPAHQQTFPIRSGAASREQQLTQLPE